MEFAFICSDDFKKDIKRLESAYPGVREDLNKFYEEFNQVKTQRALAIPGFKRKLWKTRVGSRDMRRGKKGGFRIIFYFDDTERPDEVYLLTIYPKSEREALSSEQLWDIYKRFLSSFK